MTPAAQRAVGELVDLASERLGGAVLAASDDFFAAKENMLGEAAPRFDPDRYTDRGKWMDGWETRRRRGPGHDWALVRLGLPGIIRELVVDTSHFKGNQPESCAVDACAPDGRRTAGELAAAGSGWIEILPPEPLAPDRVHRFPVGSSYRFTHLRLRIFPDGGIARLRVLGEVVPDDLHRTAAARESDLAAVENGGRLLAASDAFFGPAAHLLLPGPPRGMHDGWETRRRRGPGHDWAVLRLAAAGQLTAVEVDTTWFKGNAPGSFSLEGADLCAGGPAADAIAAASEGEWHEILPGTSLEPHLQQSFAVPETASRAITHVRFGIHPDGGVARLRLWGRLTAGGRRDLAVRRCNTLTPLEARAELLGCCGALLWAEAMEASRPFSDLAAARARAAELWNGLDERAWREAFAAHPRIGELPPLLETETDCAEPATWSRREQAGAAGASAAVRARLAAANQAYEERFGHRFIVCAAGKSAERMLAILERRLENDPAGELRAAASEQLAITQLRLDRMLGGQ